MDIQSNNLNFALLNSKNKSLQNDVSNVKNNMDDKQLQKVCNDFESFFMQQLLDISMKNTKIAGEGTGSDIIKGMYTESLSKQSSGTLGISDMLYKFLSEKNNDKS